MQQLQLRYSCCTCPDAVQLDLCKHQSAVLMLLYPSQEARKTMLKMLVVRDKSLRTQERPQLLK
jgi:uncharacterized Zn finger protein